MTREVWIKQNWEDVLEHSRQIEMAIAEGESLRAENERLREALEFYAHRPNYAARFGMDSHISRDNFGGRARAVLKEQP